MSHTAVFLKGAMVGRGKRHRHVPAQVARPGGEVADLVAGADADLRLSPARAFPT